MTDDEPAETNAIEADDRFKVEAEQLTPEYANEVTDHINRKATSPDDACPVCGHWYNMVTPTPYRVTALPTEDAFGSGQIMPVLATVCHNCGFVRFFSRFIVDGAIERHKSGEPPRFPEKPLPGGQDCG